MDEIRVLRTSVPCTTKEHICIRCGQVILVNEVYFYRVYVAGKKFYYDGMHPECAFAMGKMVEEDKGVEYSFFRGGYFPRPDAKIIIDEMRGGNGN